MDGLLVVGQGEVAAALEQIAGTLGWPVTVVDTLEETESALPRCGTVVVTSHHEGVDGPAIAAALAHGVRYVGAMGSRATQARRREWMLANGVADEELARLRAPVGLDIGADSPGEIAVAVVAEIIALRRRGVSGGSLSERSGPIHPDLPPGSAVCPAG
ncbi:MAG TPA: XdhC family protein [Nocardioidaceae bacterium]|nr:XdhC family protein [Nocardioidaceae bacterium]